MIAALLLVLSQEHVARGDLALVQTYAESLELQVAFEKGNLLAPPALRELQRWPGVPVLELRLPITRVEASQLRKLKRFKAAVANARDATLKLLGPSLVGAVPVQPMAGELIGCGTARATESAAWLPQGVDECARKWLKARFELHPEPLERLPPRSPR